MKFPYTSRIGAENPNLLKFKELSSLPLLKIKNSKIAENSFLEFKSSPLIWNFFTVEYLEPGYAPESVFIEILNVFPPLSS